MIIPAVYLGVLWNSFPANIPVHFNFKGSVDRYGSKTDVLIITGALMFVTLIVYLLFSYIHVLNPNSLSR